MHAAQCRVVVVVAEEEEEEAAEEEEIETAVFVRLIEDPRILTSKKSFFRLCDERAFECFRVMLEIARGTPHGRDMIRDRERGYFNYGRRGRGGGGGARDK